MLAISDIGAHGARRLDPDSQNNKLQKSIHEITRRIDNHHHSALRLEQAFSSEIVKLRVRLGDYILKLISSDPEKYALKYLELEWRKCWHDPVSLARNVGSSSSSQFLKFHLQAGVGHLQHLLQFFQERFGDSGFYSPSQVQYGFSGAAGRIQVNTDQNKAWYSQVISKILIWLGDLNRYHLEVSDDYDSVVFEHVAKKYYLSCTIINPTLGLAYNQLASLSGEEDNGIEALYFYMKCITSSIKFEGGEANLSRFLEKRLVREDKSFVAEVSEKLLELIKLVLNNGDMENKEERIMFSCHQSLTSLKEVLSSENPLPHSWLAKLCTCVVLTIIKLIENPESGNAIGLCQAWLVGVSCELARCLLQTVGSAVHGDTFTEELINTKQTEMQPSNSPEESKKSSSPSGEQEKKRKKLRNLLRRRKLSCSDSSLATSSDEDLSNPSDLSEDESEEYPPGKSQQDSQDELFFSDSEDAFSEDNSEFDGDDVVIEEEIYQKQDETLVDTEKLVRIIGESDVFPAFTVCLMWLRSQPEILAGLGHQTNIFWNKIARVLTLLNTKSRDYKCSQKIDKLMNKCSERPCEEMYYFRGYKMFETQFDGMRWSGECSDVPVVEATVCRLVYLETWRSWLFHPHQESFPVRWSDTEDRAVVLEVRHTDSKSVMKHMAELWLKDEVSNLEKNRTEKCILVVDVPALLDDLQMVKRAAGFTTFNIIVPQVVIRELDNIKKKDRRARHSIRWLEKELSRGYKDVVAQESQQKKNINMPTPHRKSEDWARYNVLECLAFQKQEANNAGNQVIYLTGDQTVIQKTDPLTNKVLEELDVQVEEITNFMERFVGLEEKSKPKNRAQGSWGNKKGRNGFSGYANKGGTRRNTRNDRRERTYREESRDRQVKHNTAEHYKSGSNG